MLPTTRPLRFALAAALGLLTPACGGGSPERPAGGIIRTAPTDPIPPPTTPTLPTPSQLRTAFSVLNTGRYGHTATLLTDGRVLVAGGTYQGTLLNDRAETFEPTTEVFTELPARMVLARTNHSATRLLDGRVLIVGGWIEAVTGQLAATARAEVFDPVSGAFTETGALGRARTDHAAIRLADGRVLVTGGSALEGTFLRDLDDAEVYDPATGRFAALTPRMTHTRATHALLDVGSGRLLLAGGSDADLRLELFTPATTTFTAMPAVPADGTRYNPAGATFASGAAIVAGGSEQASVLYVSPGGTFAQSTGSPLSSPRCFATATRVSDTSILVAGGVDFVDGGRLLSTLDLITEGGVGGARTFATSLRFGVGMAAHTATRLGNGRVLFCGGLGADANQTGMNVAYVYVP
jgi:hypothetical protein